MLRGWENYDTHPEIGPLIEEYRHQMRELEYVKQDLRTHDNIDEIMQVSYEAAEIKRQIEGLVRLQEQREARERRDSLWLMVTGLAVAVGFANVLVGMGLL